MFFFHLFLAVAAASGVYAEQTPEKELLAKGIAALGGESALNALKGISAHTYLYRSQSLEESFTPGFPDNAIATVGTQTVSYNLSGAVDNVIQRIDKDYALSDYWYFGRPFLDPVNSTVVVHSGSDGYACYIRNYDNAYVPPQALGGYMDAPYTNVLLRDARRLSPKLLLQMQAIPLTATKLVYHGITYPALAANSLNITVAFNSETNLPYIIRSYEDHHIFGKSANDFVVYNYTSFAGVQMPRRVKCMYNEDNLLIDALISDIDVNPNFAKDYFAGIPQSKIKETAFHLPPSPAMASAEYGEAQIFENSQNLLWFTGYTGKLDNVTVTYPLQKELPGLIHLVANDQPFYTTTIFNMEDALLVTDAPPQQAQLVIQWCRQNLNKTPTHLLVTHHHHDHNYGAADYVAVGAKLVVPDDHKYYWQAIPGVQFETTTPQKPFIHRTKTMQVRSIYPGVKNVHAADWQYFTFSVACPSTKNNNTLAIEIADAWSPGAVGYAFDQTLTTEMLSIFREDKVMKNFLGVPIHGFPTPATVAYEETGYDYPDYKVEDFIPGGAWC